jgi:hypothetical protein
LLVGWRKQFPPKRHRHEHEQEDQSCAQSCADGTCPPETVGRRAGCAVAPRVEIHVRHEHGNVHQQTGDLLHDRPDSYKKFHAKRMCQRADTNAKESEQHSCDQGSRGRFGLSLSLFQQPRKEQSSICQGLYLKARSPHEAKCTNDVENDGESSGMTQGKVKSRCEDVIHGRIEQCGVATNIPIRKRVERDARVLRRHADHQHREPQAESCREPGHCFGDCYRRLCC